MRFAQRRAGTSVGLRLRVAFLAIAVFSLLASLVGLLSLRLIDVAQDHVVDEALPAMRAAKSLQDLGLDIIADAAELTVINDPSALSRHYGELSGAMVYARSKLTQLRGIDLESINRIDAALLEMSANIGEQFQLVEIRYILRRQTADLADQALVIADAILAKLRPAAIDAVDRLFQDTDALRAMLMSPEMPFDDVIERLDTLTDRDIFNVQTLGDLRSRVEDMRNVLEGLRNTTDAGQVAILRDRFLLDVRIVMRAMLELRDIDVRSEIGTELAAFAAPVVGEDGLTDVRAKLADIDRQVDALAQANAVLGRVLAAQVTGLFLTLEQEVGDDASHVSDIVVVAQYALITIALVAFVAAAALAWRLVIRGVARRLRQLSDATLAIADGNLDAEIAITGTDELGEMADAVRQFRANAIELQRTNAELAQFAYVASHDLKAPLRGIADLTGFLEQDLDGKVDSDSMLHMDLIKSRVARLERLLDDLLNYSRAGRGDVDIEVVNVGAMVRDAFELVAPADRFTLAFASEMPVIHTARAPLEQVLPQPVEQRLPAPRQRPRAHHRRCNGRRYALAFFGQRRRSRHRAASP